MERRNFVFLALAGASWSQEEMNTQPDLIASDLGEAMRSSRETHRNLQFACAAGEQLDFGPSQCVVLQSRPSTISALDRRWSGVGRLHIIGGPILL